jgi:ACS family tartrate transporter-like MFS transporter
MNIETMAATEGDDTSDRQMGHRICMKVIWRLIPFMLLLYIVNQIDRVNISFAALTMNTDLGFTPEIFGLGAGIFFLGYLMFEVPSNLILAKVGARFWIARIMVTWGLVTVGMVYIHSPTSFYVMRFLLGVAEAGFLPGMILYLTYWVPTAYRGRASALFILAVPLTPVIAGPLSTIILQLNGAFGWKGWQWFFLITGLPAIVLGFVTLRFLTNTPSEATWLEPAERAWLVRQIEGENARTATVGHHSLASGFSSPKVLLLGLTYFLFGLGFFGPVFWLPQIIRGFGLSNVAVGFVIAGLYGLAAIASLLWSRRSDRLGERRWHFALPCFIAAVGFAVSALLGAQLISLISLTLALCGVMAALPVFWTLPGKYFTGAAAASGIAVINSLGALAGFASPYLIGWITGLAGNFTIALVGLSLGLLIAGLLILLVRLRGDAPGLGGAMRQVHPDARPTGAVRVDASPATRTIAHKTLHR